MKTSANCFYKFNNKNIATLVFLPRFCTIEDDSDSSTAIIYFVRLLKWDSGII